MSKPKIKTVYICQSCGSEFPKWQGQCPRCEEWNSLIETIVSTRMSKVNPPGTDQKSKVAVGPRKLSDIESGLTRLKTGIFEFDRVFGGGIVPGSVTLLAGEPGIGKSTLLLQIASAISDSTSSNVLYVCGEESPEQIKLRARRLGIEGKGLELLSETDVDVISGTVGQLSSQTVRQLDGRTVKQLGSKAVGQSSNRKGRTVKPSNRQTAKLVIIDSIQALTTEDMTGGAGSIGQVRECAERLRQVSKETEIPIILVGHVTKTGGLAGPKVLEHLVDAVFSLRGDRFHGFRILRSSKNRFGSCFEVGVFEMKDRGLVEVKNPSVLFLSERKTGVPGSVVTASMEGTRSVLVEIQALAVSSGFKYPRRATSGFSLKRLQLLAAVLEKRAGFDLQDKDIYVNVASGFRILEPAADLAVLLALASGIRDYPLGPELCVFGEVGLGGEVRRVMGRERRISEAGRLGFSKILAPPRIKTVCQALSEAGILADS